MPVSVPEAMPELERVGLRPVMAHTEKGAAYMADGFARISGGAGVCGAQSVGALNLAAGLQDAYLACSPVLALTGRLPQIMQNRHAYQEVDHSAPFAAVTKFATPRNLNRRVPDLPAPGSARSRFRNPGPCAP